MSLDGDNRPPFSCKGWTTGWLKSKGLRDIQRVSAKDMSYDEVCRIVEDAEQTGLPLVLTDWHQREEWNASILSMDWLLENTNNEIEARNVMTREDVRLPFRNFVDACRAASPHATTQDENRLYAKDLSCPEGWEHWLHKLPSSILPAGSNDLIRNLPPEDRPENLMCYIGIGDTFTPLHKDLCGSVGQNLMCWSENGGSAFWFMTATEHADAVGAYFRDQGKEVDLETHLASVDELAAMPYPVYFCEQKLGDLIIVPSRSCHQVVNHGGISTKVSWSRMTLSSIDHAINSELPIYRRLCREEVYRVKQMLFRTVHEITNPTSYAQPNPPPRVLAQMLELLDQVLVEEYAPLQDQFHPIIGSRNARCDFCGADCFISLFRCLGCSEDTAVQGTHGPGFVICSGCYVEGRSCLCGIMEPVQLRPFNEVASARDQLAALVGEERFSTCGKVEDVALLRTFMAALALKGIRAEHEIRPQTRRCTPHSGKRDVNETHTIDISASIPCKGCHRNLCFKHTLTMQLIHPSEALLMRVGDVENPDNPQWHEFHKMAGKAYITARAHLIGPGPNPYLTATWAALTFTQCQPVKPKVRLGWFDQSDDDYPISLLPSFQEPVRIKEEDCSMLDLPPSDDDYDWNPKGHRPKRKSNTTSAAPRKKRKPVTNLPIPPQVEFQLMPNPVAPKVEFHLMSDDDGSLTSRPELEVAGRKFEDDAHDTATIDQTPDPVVPGPTLTDIYGLVVRGFDNQTEQMRHIDASVQGVFQYLERQEMRIIGLERRLADRETESSEPGSSTTHSNI